MYPKYIAIYNFDSVLLYSGDVAIYRTFGTDERQTGHCGNSQGNRPALSSEGEVEGRLMKMMNCTNS